jgi:hypothetical protein
MRAKISAEHLERTALVYVRQSTPGQVRDHRESQRRQYALADVARELGSAAWRPSMTIWASPAADSPSSPAFSDCSVCAGTAGAVLALEASRLARNDRDWSQLVELGAITNVLLIDHDGIYDPRLVTACSWGSKDMIHTTPLVQLLADQRIFSCSPFGVSPVGPCLALRRRGGRCTPRAET